MQRDGEETVLEVSVNIEPLCKIKCSSDSLGNMRNKVNAGNGSMTLGKCFGLEIRYASKINISS
jgi:hypothetical protein